MNINGSNYDLSFLNQMMNNDKNEINKMIKIFLDTAPEILMKMNEGLDKNNLTDVHQYAHKLKSSIDIFRIYELTDVIRDIEKNSKENINLSSIPEQVKKVNHVIENVLADISRELDS